MFAFEIARKDKTSYARLGELSTPHGTVSTPAFMAVGTQGTVKGITPEQLKGADVQVVLGNTYHLMLRPGAERIRKFGGLHRFMGWDRPILTDSGGYQVFSLARLTKKSEAGVRFQSHIDGSPQWLDPETSIAVQAALGSDIAMAFDDCTPYPASFSDSQASMELTHNWAARSLAAFKPDKQVLFGIVQGGMYPELRRQSAAHLRAMPFFGFAVGGLSVGEPKDKMYSILKYTTPLLPAEKPRYLMGVGTPADLVNAVSVGIDMFDCVLPTRNGRNGQAFTWQGKVSIKQAAFVEDLSPLDQACSCYTCSHFTKAYLHHLYKAKEILCAVLMTLHNLAFYQSLMASLRRAIRQGDFAQQKQRILTVYNDPDIDAFPEGQ